MPLCFESWQFPPAFPTLLAVALGKVPASLLPCRWQQYNPESRNPRSFPGFLYGWPCLGAINKQGTNTMATIIGAITQVLGIGILLMLGQFTLLNICIVRCLAEIVLAGYRIVAVYKYKHLFDGTATKISTQIVNE